MINSSDEVQITAVIEMVPKDVPPEKALRGTGEMIWNEIVRMGLYKLATRPDIVDPTHLKYTVQVIVKKD